MHPLRHPRNAALVGIIFIVIGALYWGLPTSATSMSTTPG